MKVSLPWLAVACFALVSWSSAQAQAQSLTGQTHTRDTWYIGFGLGSGVGSYQVNGQNIDLNQIGSPVLEPTLVTLNFKIGATISEDLLVGADLSTIRSQADGREALSGTPVSVGVQLMSLAGAVTWFPQREGFFVRGGAGLAGITANLDVGDVRYEETLSGLGLFAGAGFAFWLGDAFNLSINADIHFHHYGGDASEPENGDYLNIYFGFDWF